MASIVEYMNQNGMDSSYANRAKLAQQYWISGYKWTAAQNTQLLGYLQNWWNNTVKDNQTISSNVKTPLSASKTGYDYSADISKDKTRQNEMKQNLDNYMKSNSSLFENRWAYDKYFHYDERSDSQKALLDEYYNKANKYGLNSYENSVADEMSGISKQDSAAKQKNMADALWKLYDMVWNIQDRFDARTNALWNEMTTQTAQYLNEQADLKKMATDYYNWLIKQYDTSKGWQLMSTASRMSWSWLSYAAMASSLNWVENAWQERYNDALDSHINRLKDLSQTYNQMLQSIWSNKVNLSNNERQMLTDNLKTVWWWLESYVNLANEWIDAASSPYQSILWQKVTWIWETANTEAKAQSKQAEYEACATAAERADMIARNLQQVLWEWDYSTKYSAILNAVSKYPNDFRKALYAAVDKLGLTEWQKKIVKDNFDDDFNNTISQFIWKN